MIHRPLDDVQGISESNWNRAEASKAISICNSPDSSYERLAQLIPKRYKFGDDTIGNAPVVCGWFSCFKKQLNYDKQKPQSD